MSNTQAETLRLDVLGSHLSGRTYVALKPVHLPAKRLKKLREGVLIAGCDPLHLRIVRDGMVLARAKLGQIGHRETIHIVAQEAPQLFLKDPPRKHILLETRLHLFPASEPIAVGTIIEYDTPRSGALLVLADHVPIALADMVLYQEEPVLRIVKMLHG